jgi:integrase/recombinase XerD
VRNYAEETINNYVPALNHFLKYFHGTDVRKLTKMDLEQYQMRTVIDRGLSHSYQNTLVSVVKLFYETIIGMKVEPEFIARPRRERPLPKIMSMEQVSAMLGSVKNQKHRMMLALIYACGLRSGELINLVFDDIQSTRMMIHIRRAKGNKDRLVPLSQKLLQQLREYYKIFRPKQWLFEGQHPGEQYSKRSLQMVMKQALKAAGLSREFRLHDLRHSYATHQLEAGTNEHIIQKLLGHSSIKTTTIYTKVARTTLEKVYNPFDHLDI